MKKYSGKAICKICGEEFNINKCRTKIGLKIRMKLLMEKHWHTNGEVLFKEATGIYMPTIDRN